MVLPCRRAKKAVTAVAALVFAFMQALRRDMVPPAAEKPLAVAPTPLRPAAAETSRAAARACCRVPSPAGGDLCLLDFPSKGSRASRSRTVSVGAELQLGNHGHPQELGAQGTVLRPGPDEFIWFMAAHHAKLVEAMEDMKAEGKSDMVEIRSGMEKIILALRRQTGELRELKNEVAHQGTIQMLVICAVLTSIVTLGIFVWANYDEWMKRAGALVKIWAGEALYEFTGGWFGKKVS